MGDSFEGVETIMLQPGSSVVPYTFTFPSATNDSSNDGAIPYGTTITSSVSKALDEAGVDKTSEIIDSETNTTTLVTLKLKYPTTTGTGRYSIEFVLTLSNNAKMEFDFTRIFAEDITA